MTRRILGALLGLFALTQLACGPENLATPGVDELGTGSSELATAVPIHFNHTYGIMSAATVNALQSDAWLKDQFVDVEVRTTTRPDMTYTGTYLNLRDTYLEFFPDGTFGFPIGVAGIALGDEVAGGVEKVTDAWKKEFGDSEAYLADISRDVNGVTTPWFKLAGLNWTDTSEYTAFWLMEYFPNAGSTQPRTRREERATRYAPGKLAQNVQAAIYGLPAGDRANAMRSFKAAGMTVIGNADRFVALSANDGGTRRAFYIQPSAPGRIGLLGLVIKLNRVERKSLQLGDARLEVGMGGLPFAFLWFVPPAPVDQVVASSLAH